jgi:CubicO group peptidase (beta-lactamase class C family)
MTQDNIYWIASCTKVIVGIACMQLVEKGILALDDSKQLESLCPELKSVKVLQDDGTLVEKKRAITLRMLLSHTGTLLNYLEGTSPLLTARSWVRLYLFQRKASRS